MEDEFFDPTLTDLYEELDAYHFSLPTQLSQDLEEAEMAFGIMMHASEKLSFAYQDLIRKIEIIS
ncbi:MAG TPA: hypothetical protein VLG44_00345 [Chlamydiales bacterium]|nr:hypothetical protein [Chlamydiales bacterium]